MAANENEVDRVCEWDLSDWVLCLVFDNDKACMLCCTAGDV